MKTVSVSFEMVCQKCHGVIHSDTVAVRTGDTAQTVSDRMNDKTKRMSNALGHVGHVVTYQYNYESFTQALREVQQ